MWGPRPLLPGSGPGSQGHGALLTPGSEASEEHTGSTTASGRGLVPAAKTKAGGVCASKGSQRHHLLSVHPHSPCPDQALWFLLLGQAALPRWPILHPMGAQGPALCPSWALGHLTSSLGLRPHLCADLPWLLEVPPHHPQALPYTPHHLSLLHPWAPAATQQPSWRACPVTNGFFLLTSLEATP